MNDSKKVNSVQDTGADADADTGAEAAIDEGALEEGAAAAAVDPVEELRAEAARWQDLALRSQADLDNYRKRMAREKADAIKFSNASLLEDLLPILDNFQRGLEAARAEEGSTIYQGLSMVLRQIEDFLKDHGVEPIDTEGADFDPNLHEAVAQEFSDSVPEGKVIRELRPGFRLRDRLLRASNIIVSKGPQGGAGAGAASAGEAGEDEA